MSDESSDTRNDGLFSGSYPSIGLLIIRLLQPAYYERGININHLSNDCRLIFAYYAIKKLSF